MKMEDEVLNKIYHRIEGYRDEMVKSLGELIQVPAISPKSGGEGEAKKVELLLELINKIGFDVVERINVPDESAPHGVRPNIIARLKGESDSAQNIWIVAHTDVVPAGDLKLWDSDPFEPLVKDDKIYGRGVEDNGQELIAALYAVKALKEEGITSALNINMAFVADEEVGSEYGIKPLLEKGLFQKDDMIIVPDAGNAEGTLIEVAEKTIMWVKITALGKQCHGARPNQGINAHFAAMKLGVKLREELHKRYDKKDDMFDPAISTFEPTKKDANVPNINTIPGEDIFYMDFRILPDYDPNEVLDYAKSIADSVSLETGARFEFALPQFNPAPPPTSPESPVVIILKDAIMRIYNTKPYAGGIGGGTCAAIFRRAGYPAVVWAKVDQVGHAPNEYVIIDNMLNDAKVYATIFCSK
jgi:succinyl-diaminopimelate desuccinylase